MAVINAAIPPPHSRRRLETYFRRNSLMWICCCWRACIHPSSSEVFVVGSFLSLEVLSCWLSSVRSPVAHRTVRKSSTLNILLLSPAQAKATRASRCSCRSPVGRGALMGASSTCGSEEIPVLLRPTCCLSRIPCFLRLPRLCAHVSRVALLCVCFCHLALLLPPWCVCVVDRARAATVHESLLLPHAQSSLDLFRYILEMSTNRRRQRYRHKTSCSLLLSLLHPLHVACPDRAPSKLSAQAMASQVYWHCRGSCFSRELMSTPVPITNGSCRQQN